MGNNPPRQVAWDSYLRCTTETKRGYVGGRVRQLTLSPFSRMLLFCTAVQSAAARLDGRW